MTPEIQIDTDNACGMIPASREKDVIGIITRSGEIDPSEGAIAMCDRDRSPAPDFNYFFFELDGLTTELEAMADAVNRLVDEGIWASETAPSNGLIYLAGTLWKHTTEIKDHYNKAHSAWVRERQS